MLASIHKTTIIKECYGSNLPYSHYYFSPAYGKLNSQYTHDAAKMKWKYAVTRKIEQSSQ